jgi:hypothetical protein
MAGGFVRSELTFSLVLTAAMLTDLTYEGKGFFKMSGNSRLVRFLLAAFPPDRMRLMMSEALLIAMGN